MNELDLLKTHWQEDNEHIKFKKDDIIAMIHKSSSSIVKWIFTICCLEFILGLALIFSNSSDKKAPKLIEIIDNTADVVFYIIILYFIYRFYILLKEIKNVNNTKILLQAIVDIRKNADRYIKFNLLFISFAFIVVFILMIYEKFSKNQSWGEQLFILIISGVLMYLFWLLVRWLMKLYYKLVYGILLKKLNKNYEELLKIEQQ